MVATPLLVDTGATMNLIHVHFLPKKWHAAIQPYTGSIVQSANKSPLSLLGVIRLCLRLGDLQVKVRFGVVRELVTRILVGAPFIDKFVAGIFPPERRIVPRDSPPVPILAVDQPAMILATVASTSDSEDAWEQSPGRATRIVYSSL